MANILLLGAGFVTGPLVDYLLEKKHHITIGSQFLRDAEMLSAGREGLTPLQVDAGNVQQLIPLVRSADLVISFVPFFFHVAVAKICISEKTSMVTASYSHEDMWKLNQAAKAAGITLLNEIGLDPGIDHMTAMQFIDAVHQRGGQVNALVSWCGGIPAPDVKDNPLAYKFSWSPLAVLRAVKNDAKYLCQGEVKTVVAEKLLSSMRDVVIDDELRLRGYFNRDSLGYRQAYGIPEVQTLLRGTLRYPGFGTMMGAARKVGLLSETHFSEPKAKSWNQLMTRLTAMDEEQLEQFLTPLPLINESFAWLGCFSQQPVVGNSPMEAFCNLLTEKLKYHKGELDMVVMQHRLILTDAKGNKSLHRSTLVEKGEVNGFTAMAKTVGYPAAIAADKILSGEITRKGVCIPVSADIYLPVLVELATLGIQMKDESVTDQTEADFLNHL